MKLILWIAFAVIAALWSSIVFIFAELTKWLVASMSGLKPGELITNAGDWPVPAWLSIWIDPALVKSFQASWMDVFSWLNQAVPSLEGVVSWLTPLIWVIWGVVMLIGLLAAFAGHLLIGKLSRSTRLTHSPS